MGPTEIDSIMSMKSKQGRQMRLLSTSGEKKQHRYPLDHPGILSVLRNEDQIQVSRSLGSTWGRSPHIPYLSPTVRTQWRASHLGHHILDDPRTIPEHPIHLPPSWFPTKIASVRSRMQVQARADVCRDGKNAGDNGKAAGAHAPAAPPPQAARPATRSA